MTERVRTGYEALLAQVDRRIELLTDGTLPDEGAGPPRRARPGRSRPRSRSGAMVIEFERDELDRMVANRRVSRPVAAEVRAALDVDETTMRP